MKGDVFPSEASAFRDRETGARVWQITNAPSISHPSYFLQRPFYPDRDALFFVSFRSEAAQLYEAELPDGPIRQLTDGPAIHPFSPALTPDAARIVFTRGDSLWWIDRKTLAEQPIGGVDGASIGEPSLSADGEWAVTAFKREGQNALYAVRLDGRDATIIPFPRTVIHPQFHPLEPEWIEFAGDPAPRMHRVRRDGTGLECLYEHGNDEFVVHETFLGGTGDLVFTVWPKALCRMDWGTREVQTIASFNAWHIAPDRAGARVLCDTNHPDLGIHLVEVSTGRLDKVCLSEASSGGTQWRTSRYALAGDFEAARSAMTTGRHLSWMEAGADTVYGPQWTHPHPSWSHDEKRIAFASDRTGTTQVYVCELGDKITV